LLGTSWDFTAITIKICLLIQWDYWFCDTKLFVLDFLLSFFMFSLSIMYFNEIIMYSKN